MQTNTNVPKTFVLEGNIGAGKSTLLRILQEALPVQACFEPTDKWQSIGTGGNLLDLFYKDTPRWAYTFQSYAFISRIQSQIDSFKVSDSSVPALVERSVYCDRFCFAKNCYEAGLMSKLEWDIYQEWFGWLVDQYVPRPLGFIYLRTTPERSYQRLLKRSRSEEVGVSYDYLSLLHQKHEDWLVKKNDILPTLADVPVLILDCDREFESDVVTKKQMIDQVANFIKQPIIHDLSKNICVQI